VKEIHHFKNGKLHGEYLGYYQSGYLARRSHFYNNITRGPALKFFDQVDSVVETESYFLDVMGKQYAYYRKMFDVTGNLIREERTLRLDFNCNEGQSFGQINFADDFRYDSVYLIVGEFRPNFSLGKTASIDTIRALQLPASVPLNDAVVVDGSIRGKCIFFVGTNEKDSGLVNVKIRWFEETIASICVE
jgi:hypothetical protein